MYVSIHCRNTYLETICGFNYMFMFIYECICAYILETNHMIPNMNLSISKYFSAYMHVFVYKYIDIYICIYLHMYIYIQDSVMQRVNMMLGYSG
jgi:hypothetical protein